MEIVDAQVHVPRLVVDWRERHPRLTTNDRPSGDPGHAAAFEPADQDTLLTGTLIAMDAAGVDALVIDEWIGFDGHGRLLPGHELEDGTYRSTFEFSKYAVDRYPERFCFLSRVTWSDPELDAVVEELAAIPEMRCLRVSTLPAEIEAFRTGGYERLFGAALRHDLPVFVSCDGARMPHLEPYLRRFPELRFVIDHMGAAAPSPDLTGPERYRDLEALLELGSRYPNLAVKWSRFESQSSEVYPYPDILPYLLRALAVFGRERILWASDWSQHRMQTSWAQSFAWILESDELSSSDKEWILGRSTRTILDWPAVTDRVGEGLYFDCAQAHPTVRIAGADETSFLASMREHMRAWHPEAGLQATDRQILGRARR